MSLPQWISSTGSGVRVSVHACGRHEFTNTSVEGRLLETRGDVCEKRDAAIGGVERARACGEGGEVAAEGGAGDGVESHCRWEAGYGMVSSS
jgi:hypothetical protein